MESKNRQYLAYGMRRNISLRILPGCPEGVTVVTTNLVIRDARESSEVEASWEKFDTVIENLVQTRVDYITLSGAPLVLAKGVERYRELLKELRRNPAR